MNSSWPRSACATPSTCAGPGILANLVLLLQAMGREGEAQQELTGALRHFPEDERLLTALRRFRGRGRESRGAGPGVSQFRHPAAARGKCSRCRGPLDGSLRRGDARPATMRRQSWPISRPATFFWKTISTAAAQKAEEAMEGNPFEPENHHLLALLFLQKQQYRPGGHLRPERPVPGGNTWTTTCCRSRSIRPGRTGKNSARPWRWPCKNFPQSPELLELSGRGR